MTLLSAQNTKMQRASFRTFNFGLPAFRSLDGQVTCPNASHCVKGCYAKQGTFNFTTTKNSYQLRFEATKAPDFVERITAEIQALRPKAYRWNDSGDFYNDDYLEKAFKIAKATPLVIHYAYTKEVERVKSKAWPENFIFIFSYGGKQDALIDPKTDRHCKVFRDSGELSAARYTDASFDDSLAWQATSNKIGLLYHGSMSKRFHTTLNQFTKE